MSDTIKYPSAKANKNVLIANSFPFPLTYLFEKEVKKIRISENFPTFLLINSSKSNRY